MKIFKYPVKLGENEVPMPIGAIPVQFAAQDRIPTVWAMVDPSRGDTIHRIVVTGTGHEVHGMPSEAHYVGTIFDGPLVWHCLSFGDSV